MWRNGVALPNTAYTYFTDSGLSNYTTYNYQIEAFDLANNASAPLTFSITTPNSIPPTAPALSGKADSTQEITLTWTASSCPAPISTYVIYEGTSPTSLTKFQTTKGNILTANIWHLTAGTTYYFAVQATQQGLVSPMSTTIAVTTTGAPSAPTHVSATALMATEVEVSWQAPTSGGPVAWYHVYRGTSPHNVTQLVCTANKTSCINYPVSASTTYYYGVEATDSAQNYSPISDIASVTTPAKK
jgi:fibronectin type 3 domain-containing protein